MMLLKKVKNNKLFYFNNVIISILLLMTFMVFDSKTIENKNNSIYKYQLNLTYYYSGDGTGSSNITFSGITTDQFTIDENGWYHYNKDGKNYLVVAAALKQCRDNGNHCGVNVDKYGLAKNITYYDLYDKLKLQIGEKIYDAIVLDACGACMWAERDETTEKIDVFTANSKAVNPAMYENRNLTSNAYSDFTTTYDGENYKEGYIYKTQQYKALKDFNNATQADVIEKRIDIIIDNIFKNAEEYSDLKFGASAYIPDVTYLNGSFRNPIVYFNQGDYAAFPYSTYGTIKSHGCGPTAMSIVISSFKQQTISPIDNTNWACKNGYCSASGSYHSLICALANQHGLNCSQAVDHQTIINSLASGNSLVVVLANQGIFTNGGHFLVLTGVDNNGNISIADPGSRSKTEKTYTYNTLVDPLQGHIVKFWIISG